MTTAQPAVVRAPLRATLPIGMAWARRRYRIYPDDVEASRRKVEAALDLVEAELDGGEYLVGEGFTVADLTASSLLFPLAWPDETPYDLPKPDRWEFREDLADRPALEWVREIYRRHRPPSAARSG
jgi:glutathione S-transferase